MSRYYVRARGRVSGPHELDALRTLVRRGRVSRVHELSEDRREWVRATQVEGLFDDDGGRRRVEATTEPGDADEAPADPAPADPATVEAPRRSRRRQWHYSIAGREEGPVGLETLKELADRGALTADDLIIADGDRDWVLASSVAQLGLGRQRQGASGASSETFEVGPLHITVGILMLIMGLGGLALGCSMSLDGEQVLGMFAGSNDVRTTTIAVSLTLIGLVVAACGLLAMTGGVGLFLGKRWGLVCVMVYAVLGIIDALALIGLLPFPRVVVLSLFRVALYVFMLVVALRTVPARRPVGRRGRR